MLASERARREGAALIGTNPFLDFQPGNVVREARARAVRGSAPGRLAAFAALLSGVALLCGCGTTSLPRDYTPTLARFFLEAGNNEGTSLALPQSGVRVTVNSKPVFTEGDIMNVELVQVDLGKCLVFQLTPTARRDFYRMTGSHQGRRIVLVIDDAPIGARRIDGAITNGEVFVFVELPDSELPALVQNLKKSSAVLQREIARKE